MRTTTPTPRRRARRRAMVGHSALVVALLAAAAALSGCRTSGLVFGTSQLRIAAPRASSTVTLPLRLSWSAGGLYRPGDQFAVFLDTRTIRPGQDVMSLVPETCRRLPLCPRADYLEEKQAWVTTSPSLVLDQIPVLSLTGASSGKEYHTVTVVILDKAGRRIGEQFASADFVYVRPGR